MGQSESVYRSSPSLIDNHHNNNNQQENLEQPLATIENINNIPIMAFGDSLTAGYFKRGTEFHPYSDYLTELLTNYNIKVYEYGLSGEKTNEMEKRLQRNLQKKVLAEDLIRLNNAIFPENEFKAVIIIGGTNDLAYSTIEKETIVNNLTNMYKYCMNQLNIKYVIASSIPSTTFEHEEKYKQYLEKKEFINNEIKKFCFENNEKMRFVDICNLLSYKNCNDEERKLYWDDHLHFTPKGYQKFAEILFENGIKEIVNNL
ncbi:hypothetical protein ABK040_009684 [Willaertia magna]